MNAYYRNIMVGIKRVKYQNQPLVEVIYQLRFPTILSINATEPVEFQEKIRKDYPFFRKIVQENEVIVNEVKRTSGSETNYEFVSEDKKKKVNLTSSFVAVSSLVYDRWEVFQKVLEPIRKALEDIYKPAFYTRVGLRYKDVIDRTKFCLQGKGWVDLIKPEILGVINTSNQNTLQTWSVNSEFTFPDSDIATKQLFHLAAKVGEPLPVMVFDCDYYKMGNIKLDEVENLSNDLHERSSCFLRSAITEELHNAMKPQAL